MGSTVHSTEITADGRIAIGGAFTAVNGSSRNYAALLHADGGLETNFNTTGGPSSTIYAVLPGDGGNLTIGGAFQNIGGQPPRYLARLAGDAGKTRPAVASLNPVSGVAGEKLMVFGSNLGNLTSAEFSGGVTATVFPISQTRVELEIPAGAMSGPVTLRNAFGETTSLAMFKLLAAPLPVITGIPSESVAIGSGFLVSGKNFYDVTSVRIGVITASFVVHSATSMTVTVPTNAVTARVILSGPGGTAESASDLLVIKAPPAFTSAASSSGMIGQNFSFTLKATYNPTGFTAAPLPAGLVLNPATGQISGIPTTAGLTTVSISATNEGGTTESSLAITISPPPPPQVTSVSPDQIPTGGKILVSGTYLFQTTSVTVGGVAAVFEILSDGRIAVVMPAGVESGVVVVTTLQGSITSTGSVTRWDFQAGSQIVTGFGENSSGQATPPVGLDDAVAIAAGQNHSLALRADGSVSGWGANEAGQASPPPGIFPAIAIAAGGYHSLALQADGTVAAWGRNDESQCSGASGLSNIAAIAAGGFHSLALTRMGTVTAWGSDSLGQTSVPENLGGVVAIAAGGNFSVALKSDGSVVAWGDNSSGQTEIPASATGIVAITAGSAHVVALKADGTLIGWGANWAGQINLPAPTASPITQISAGKSPHDRPPRRRFLRRLGRELERPIQRTGDHPSRFHRRRRRPLAHPQRRLSHPADLRRPHRDGQTRADIFAHSDRGKRPVHLHRTRSPARLDRQSADRGKSPASRPAAAISSSRSPPATASEFPAATSACSSAPTSSAGGLPFQARFPRRPSMSCKSPQAPPTAWPSTGTAPSPDGGAIPTAKGPSRPA